MGAYEPGAPSLRAMAPSMVGGAVVPLVVYHFVRPHVASDAIGLCLAGIPAALFVVGRFARSRRIDPIGTVMLAGFAVGVAASLALGGNALLLKLRESVFTAAFGLVCLWSLRSARPAMFHIGKALSAGDDAERRAAYDRLLDHEPGRAAFRVITTVWGIGLLVECALRVVLALLLPTGTFLALAPVVGFAFIGSCFAFTVVWAKRGRRLAEAEGIVYPSVPAGA